MRDAGEAGSTRMTQVGIGGRTRASQPVRDCAAGRVILPAAWSSSRAFRKRLRAAGSPIRPEANPPASLKSSSTRTRLPLTSVTRRASSTASGDMPRSSVWVIRPAAGCGDSVPRVVGVRNADAGDLCPSVVAHFGNDVAAVTGPAFAVVEPYDIGELDNRGRVLHTGGIDELNTVRGGHVPLKPHERCRRSVAEGVVQQ